MFKCLGRAHISLQIPPEADHELAAQHGFEGVELVDMERLPPGASGVVDARGFPAALGQIGFDGPVIVEPFSADVGAASLAAVWPG